MRWSSANNWLTLHEGFLVFYFFLKSQIPCLLQLLHPSDFSCLSPTSSNILLSSFLYRTSQFTLTAWHLHIFLMCGKSPHYALLVGRQNLLLLILQKLVMPGGMFPALFAGKYRLWPSQTPEYWVRNSEAGSKASRNPGGEQRMQRQNVSGSIILFGLP